MRLTRIHRTLLCFLPALWAGQAMMVAAGSTEKSKEIEITQDTFACIRNMPKVRNLYVGNLLGDLEASLAVARSPSGGIYPPGTVLQLLPGEVMVKHHKGYNTATKDWEFIELDVDKTGSAIRTRGFVDVKNRFGGNCFGCHIKAKPQWDLVCETGHGCDTIPLTHDMISVMQKTDPRCESDEKLTDIEIVAAEELKKVIAELSKQAKEKDL